MVHVLIQQALRREALLVRCPEWCLCLSDQAPIRFMTLGGPVSLPGVRKVYTNKASTPLVAECIAEKHDLSSNHCRGLSYGKNKHVRGRKINSSNRLHKTVTKNDVPPWDLAVVLPVVVYISANLLLNIYKIPLFRI